MKRKAKPRLTAVLSSLAPPVLLLASLGAGAACSTTAKGTEPPGPVAEARPSTPTAPPQEPAPDPPRPWTRAFREKSLLVAREVSVEGPPGLLAHVAILQDPQTCDHEVRTTPEGLLQEASVRPGAEGALARCQLDGLAIAATRRLEVLERPLAEQVVVRARGEAVWQRVDGADRRTGAEVVLRGRLPR